MAAESAVASDADAGAATVLLAVNGGLMRGLPAEHAMHAAGATFVEEARTAPAFRLWNVDDAVPFAHPAMQRVGDGCGASVAVELWAVPAAGLASILNFEPVGLAVGKVPLADGRTVLGVLGEAYRWREGRCPPAKGSPQVAHACPWRTLSA